MRNKCFIKIPKFNEIYESKPQTPLDRCDNNLAIPTSARSFKNFNTIAVQCNDEETLLEMTPRFESKPGKHGNSHHFDVIKLSKNKKRPRIDPKFSSISPRNAVTLSRNSRSKTPPSKARNSIQDRASSPLNILDSPLFKTTRIKSLKTIRNFYSSYENIKLLETRSKNLGPRTLETQKSQLRIKKNSLMLNKSPKQSSLIDKLENLTRSNEGLRTRSSMHRQAASRQGYRTKLQKDPAITKNSFGTYAYVDCYVKDVKLQSRIVKLLF